MIAYSLAFIILITLIPSMWQSVLIMVATLIFSPDFEKQKILISIILSTLLFFLILNSPDQHENSMELNKIQGFAYSLDDKKIELYSNNTIEKPFLLYLKNQNELKGQKIVVHNPRSYKRKTYNTNEFVFSDYIKSRGYSDVFFAKEYDVLSDTKEKDFFLRRLFGELRQNMWSKINYLNRETEELYSALIMGSLSKETTLSLLAKSHGIIHLFVVSGFHFNIIFIGIRKLFFILSKKNYNLSIIAACLSSAIYFGVLGGGFGSTRAFISIIIASVSFFIGRTYNSENTLFLLSFFWIIAFPESLSQIGFVLSFVSTYTVILVSNLKTVKNIENTYQRMLLVSLFSSSILIFFLSVFGTSLPLFSFVNIVVSSIVFSAFLPFLFLFSIIPEFLTFFVEIFSVPINLIGKIYVDFLCSVENISQVRLMIPPKVSILVISLVLLLFISRKLISYGWRRKNILILAIVVILIFVPDVFNSDELEIISFDLTDGEAYLIKTQGYNMVYDVGNDSRIVELLKFEGVGSIDLLVISHADLDHYGMIDEIYQNFDVKKLVVDAEESYMELGSLCIDFYKSNDIFGSRNDQSVVCRLNFRGTGVLLTGDIQAMGIRDILKYDLNGIDILKAPHHGSYTENFPDLLSACSPEAVIISGGRGKRIDKTSIYDELNRVKMPFYDTMKNGEIRLRYNGGKWRFITLKKE